MDKYRKVRKSKDNSTRAENEIRVTAAGSVSFHVSSAVKAFTDMERSDIVIKATGNALAKAITLAEIIKRRFHGLHQISNIGSTEIVDEYEPLEEGLDTVIDVRQVPSIDITLSKNELDTTHKGYQTPIDESLVIHMDVKEMARGRGRGRGKGRGRGRKGTSGEDDEEEKKLSASENKKASSNAEAAADNDKDEDGQVQAKTNGKKNTGRTNWGWNWGDSGNKGGKAKRNRVKSKGGDVQNGGGDNFGWGWDWNFGYNGYWDNWNWWGYGGGAGAFGGQTNRRNNQRQQSGRY